MPLLNERQRERIIETDLVRLGGDHIGQQRGRFSIIFQREVAQAKQLLCGDAVRMSLQLALKRSDGVLVLLSLKTGQAPVEIYALKLRIPTRGGGELCGRAAEVLLLRVQ